MKLSHLALILLAALCALLAIEWRVLKSEPGPRETRPVPMAEDPRVGPLLERVQELEQELARLRSQPTPDVTQRAPASLTGTEPTPASPGEVDLREVLARYVASFEGGGTGIEYYRLQVEAHLPELLEDILPLIANRSQHGLLRTSLVRMLGDPRLMGHARVLATLLAAAAEQDREDLARSAAASAAAIATAKDAPLLERRWHACAFDEGRNLLLDRIVHFAGEEVNPAVERLLHAAPGSGPQRLLIPRISSADLPRALRVFRSVSHMQPAALRLDAAWRVHEFRSDAFRAFVQDWIAREPDEDVRNALGEAAEALATIPNHHPEQMIGPPNVPNPPDDNVLAWAAAGPDNGREWLRLQFDPPLRAHAVRIHETCTPGAIVEIKLRNEFGETHGVWSGDDPTRTAGVFEARFALTEARIRQVELVLDTRKAPGFNEIDAVELLGPDRRSWATGANASSYYGNGQQEFIFEGGWFPRDPRPPWR